MPKETSQKDTFPQNKPKESIFSTHTLDASHYRVLSLTAEIGKAIVQNSGLESILQRCAEAIVRNLGFPSARIWVRNIPDQSFDLKASAGSTAAKTPSIKNDLLNDSRFPDRKWAEKEGLAALGGVPLIVGNDLVGILGLFSETTLSQSDLQFLTPVTDQIALCIVRKQAENALQESENRFRGAFENAPGPVSMNSPGGGFLMVNHAMCNLLGCSEKELIVSKIQEMAHPDDATVFQEHLTLLLEANTRMASFESRYTHKTGRVIPGYTNITLLRAETDEPLHFVIHIQDVSQHKNLEKQMLEAQKMEAIGTLAGGIAHDFNNLLMAIQGRVSLILMDLDAAHPHSQHLSTIESHIQSAASLTRELLGFARGGKYAAKPTDLNGLLKNITHMLDQTRKEICIHGIYQPNLWIVDVDHKQIKQAFKNIYINAWQAMNRGGDLFIETRNVAVVAGVDCPDDVRPGDFVRISVTDTGIGMNEKTRRRIFEPFFTTRQMGKGTGMGLASTYGIIRNHGGFITVDSEPEKGSTFFVFLPVSDRSKGKTDKTVCRSDGNETILIVDDDDIIIEVGKQLLENSGYQVITARGGREAIDRYKEMGHLIDLVILDMVMPHPNGEETLRELKKIDDNVKVIISSGYCLDSNQPPLRDLEYQKLIQKPFKISELLKAIREVLEIKG